MVALSHSEKAPCYSFKDCMETTYACIHALVLSAAAKHVCDSHQPKSANKLSVGWIGGAKKRLRVFRFDRFRQSKLTFLVPDRKYVNSKICCHVVFSHWCNLWTWSDRLHPCPQVIDTRQTVRMIIHQKIESPYQHVPDRKYGAEKTNTSKSRYLLQRTSGG